MGCEGDGTFSSNCSCKDKGVLPPVTITCNGSFHSFGAECEIHNTSTETISWMHGSIYYFDAQGNQLAQSEPSGKEKLKRKRYVINGEDDAGLINTHNFDLAPGEKETDKFGWSDKDKPAQTARISVVFDAWCFGKDPDQFCVNVGLTTAEAPR